MVDVPKIKGLQITMVACAYTMYGVNPNFVNAIHESIVNGTNYSIEKLNVNKTNQ